MASSDPNSANASRIFANFIAQGRSEQPGDFESLCQAHPTLAEELTHLRQAYRLALRLLDSTASSSTSSSVDVRLTYPVVEEINRGGMGSVYRVLDPHLDRELALKRALPGANRARFLRECRIAGRLDHPSIVPVHAQGVDDQGYPWFSMKLVRGEDLAQIIVRHHAGEADWPLPRLIGILIRVCDAVDYAHHQGVLHRDLKPPNVMIGSFGEVYVMDWGLAVDSREQPEDESGNAAVSTSLLEDVQTHEGEVLGTLRFMAPEQARAEVRTPDPRLDIYGLGAILYNILAGHPPYAGDWQRDSLLSVVRSGPPAGIPPDPHRRPPALIAVAQRAMARTAEDRYPSAKALAQDLQAWLDGGVVKAFESGAFAEVRRLVLRHRLASILMLVLLLTGLAATLLYLHARAVAPEVDQARDASKKSRADAWVREGFLELHMGPDGAKRAQVAFEAALEENRQDVFAALGASVAVAKIHGPPVAQTYFEGWLAKNPNSGLTDLRHVMALLGRRDGAPEPHTPSPSDTALDLFVHAELARSKKSHNSLVSAAGHLELAIQRSSYPVAVIYDDLLHLYTCLKEQQKAEALGATIEQLWPNDALVLVQRSHAARRFGNVDDALELAKRATQSRPSWPEVWISLAHAHRDRSEWGLALQALAEAERRGSLSSSGCEIRASALTGLSRHAEAEAALREYLRSYPESGRLHSQLGCVLFYRSMEKEALPHLDRAVDLMTAATGDSTDDFRRDLAFAYSFRGLVNQRLGKTASARSDFEEAVSANPEIEFAWENLALLKAAAKEFEAAVEAAERAVALKPDHPDFLATLGYVLHVANRSQEAIPILQRAVTARPENAQAWKNLGVACVRTANAELGQTAFRKVFELSPTNAVAVLPLLDIQVRMGRWQQALTDLASFESRGGATNSAIETRRVRAQSALDLSRRLDEGWLDAPAILSSAREQAREQSHASAVALFERALELEPQSRAKPVMIEAAACAIQAAAWATPAEALAHHRRAIHWLRIHAGELRTTPGFKPEIFDTWLERFPFGEPENLLAPEPARLLWAELAKELRSPAN